jgi:hypothetical protein
MQHLPLRAAEHLSSLDAMDRGRVFDSCRAHMDVDVSAHVHSMIDFRKQGGQLAPTKLTERGRLVAAA